jgi:hypothetical protein
MNLFSRIKLAAVAGLLSLAAVGLAWPQVGQGTLTTAQMTTSCGATGANCLVPVQIPTAPLNNNALISTFSSYLATLGQDIASGTAPTVFHSGQSAPLAVTDGTDHTATNTETAIVEVFVPVNTTLTGIKWMGLATSTGNVQFSLATSAGVPITAAQTASTATTGTANYQTAAFVTPYVALGPRKYFILMQNSGSNHYRAHTIGNFGASVKTGETFGTFTTVTAPTTFTTAVGPIADVY